MSEEEKNRLLYIAARMASNILDGFMTEFESHDSGEFEPEDIEAIIDGLSWDVKVVDGSPAITFDINDD